MERIFFLADPGPQDECDEPFQTVGHHLHTVICDWVAQLGGGLKQLPAHEDPPSLPRSAPIDPAAEES